MKYKRVRLKHPFDLEIGDITKYKNRYVRVISTKDLESAKSITFRGIGENNPSNDIIHIASSIEMFELLKEIPEVEIPKVLFKRECFIGVNIKNHSIMGIERDSGGYPWDACKNDDKLNSLYYVNMFNTEKQIDDYLKSFSEYQKVKVNIIVERVYE